MFMRELDASSFRRLRGSFERSLQQVCTSVKWVSSKNKIKLSAYSNHLIFSLKLTTSPTTIIAGVGNPLDASVISSSVETTTSC